MSLILTLLVIAAVIALAVVLAYVPMNVLVLQMAKNVRHYIQRQRERRNAPRAGPDRRKMGM
jgi:uncharacterized protein HemY